MTLDEYVARLARQQELEDLINAHPESYADYIEARESEPHD